MLGNAGTSGLLTDFGIFGIMERYVNIIGGQADFDEGIRTFPLNCNCIIHYT